MTVAELIAKLQEMPLDARVTMWVSPMNSMGRDICWVERRYSDSVYLNDEYYTPYYGTEG